MTWELALHLANILLLCSFLLRDILMLRLLSICAGVLFCLYFYHKGIYEPIYWNVLFSIVNTVQIGLIWFKRRKIPLLLEEQFLQSTFFHTLQSSEIRSLYRSAAREAYPKGEAIVSRHDTSQNLRVIVVGNIRMGGLDSNDIIVSRGHFIGVRSYLSRQPYMGSAIAQSDTICLRWSSGDLRQWVKQTTERHNLLLSALSNDLIFKMELRNTVDDPPIL